MATHAGLGKAMLETAAIISGGTENVQTVELYPGGGAEDVENALRDQIYKAGRDEKILCLVDIPGGSPARVAASLALESPNFHVVSGVNLGMLTETLMLRDSMDIAQLKEHIITSAVSTITDVGSKLLTALSEEQEGRGEPRTYPK
ncbi:MAG TPA: PTS sugar transporter subunit IIA [Pseudoflavonifractor sp.]|nr:PTS sugar transporter subunit IIA [Pseudoflavonifractor sp.]